MAKTTEALIDKLIQVQVELKAPKAQHNKFGGYNYRNCEDILEAAKPLLKEAGLMLTLTDEVIMVGNRFYVKVNASITDGKETHTVSAFAREEETKKGMDGSQITGASSSYARKYALNGLFLIDDTKDSDTTNKGEEEAKNEQQQQPAKEQPKEQQQDADNRPWLTEEALNKILARMAKGEAGLYEEANKAFRMKKQYREQLKAAATQKQAA